MVVGGSMQRMGSRLARALAFACTLSLAAPHCPPAFANDAPAGAGESRTSRSRDVIRTTAVRPAINVQSEGQINLVRARLSLYPVTGAAAPVYAAEPPKDDQRRGADEREPGP